jgi:myo-inositol-1(or 4)-monophosphatase
MSVVRPAARLAREMRAAGVATVATKTSPTDVVTAADNAVEQLIINALRDARPDDAVIGEETGASADLADAAVRWIVDPIDGTVNYLYGIPHYAVSVAAQVSSTVVAGVVCNAATGDEWTAVRGAGSYHGSRRLACSAVTELGQTLIGTGFGYEQERRAYQAGVMAALLPRVRDVRRMGTAALDLCLTAEGAFDAYFEKGLHIWDYAAGALIAEEAGVQVTGLAGAAPGLQFLLAAPPGIYQQLHDELVALDAAGGP